MISGVSFEGVISQEGVISVRESDSARPESGRRVYSFDRVYPPAAGQSVVFDDVRPAVCALLGGFNVCVLAYGQTGSGKTHTMDGPAHDPGLLLRTVRELFALLSASKGGGGWRCGCGCGWRWGRGRGRPARRHRRRERAGRGHGLGRRPWG